mmetsp:Transcript_12963/g.31775  ORF Transcript_12963/g.31775 Transcript_12963/m.31775 type:complete len:146 (+) Transcript_12963:293-730(+)
MASLLVGGVAVAAAVGYYWYRKGGDGVILGEGPDAEALVHQGELPEPQNDNTDLNAGAPSSAKNASVATEEKLPEGWTLHFHPETGRKYYYHKETGQSSWSFPKVEDKENIQLPPGWTKHFDGEGTPYFYNATTGESEWEIPSFG